MSDVKRRLEYVAHLPRGGVDVCASAVTDTHACVTQVASVAGVTRELLPHASRRYNLNPTFVRPIRYASKACGIARGNRFVVILRSVESVPDMTTLTTHGFLNYFPLSHFGASGVGWHEIGLLLAQGMYEEVLRGWLQCEAEAHPLAYTHYLKYLSASPDDATLEGILLEWSLALKGWPECSNLRRALPWIASKVPPEQVLEKLGVGHMDANALQGYLWNAAVSRRVHLYGKKVVVGDIVCVVSDGDGSWLREHDPTATAEYRKVSTEQEASSFSFADVVIAVPGRRPAVLDDRSATDSFLASKGITPERWARWSHLPMESFYRHVCVKPECLETTVVTDPFSHAVLKPDLFLIQERLDPEDATLLSRLRSPCAVNVTPQYEAMMKDCVKGPLTVGISCVLPRGCHMSTLLREVYDVRYKNFHELLIPN